MSRLINVFPNTDLRSGHDGLKALAQKHKQSVDALSQGDFLLFINRRQSAFKLLSPENLVVHYRSPHGRVDIKAIKFIPHCFNGTAFNYNAALTLMLKEQLKNQKGL